MKPMYKVLDAKYTNVAVNNFADLADALKKLHSVVINHLLPAYQNMGKDHPVKVAVRNAEAIISKIS